MLAQHRLVLRALSLFALFAAATLPVAGWAQCDESSSDPVAATAGALGDAAAAGATTFTLIQGGFFDDALTREPNRVPRLAHIGLVDAPGGDWTSVTDVPIEYSNGVNEPVQVTLPAGSDGKLLAYTIMYTTNRYGREGDQPQWRPVRYVDASKPQGKMVYLPVSNGAGYPFTPECYRIGVRNADTVGTPAYFPGKTDAVYFGYTSASEQDYFANNDVPWDNGLGESKLAGVLSPDHQHDGGYKGTYFMLPEWVRVPEGKNLVFKLHFTEHGGTCYISGDTYFKQSAETQTYFMQVDP